MGLLILSKDVIAVEDTLKSLIIVAFRKGLRMYIEEYRKREARTGVDVYFDKHYGGDDKEYFYLGLDTEEDMIQQFHLMDLKVNGDQFYRLAVTDQGNHDHLMYDFTLAYLRLNPDQCISFYGETFSSWRIWRDWKPQVDITRIGVISRADYSSRD